MILCLVTAAVTLLSWWASACYSGGQGILRLLLFVPALLLIIALVLYLVVGAVEVSQVLAFIALAIVMFFGVCCYSFERKVQ